MVKKKDKSSVQSKKEASRFDISQETKNSIWGISAFILAIISVLSFVGKAGWAGEGFDLIARSLFGWGFFIIPIAFVLLGISFLRSISRNIYSSAVLGTLLFIMAILAVFYIFGKTDFDGRLVQGGYLGIILGFPLLESVGFSASLIILLAAIFIALLVTLNVPIYKLISKENKEEFASRGMVDHVVVKKGNETVTQDDKKTAQEAKPVATVASKQAKPEITDKEFVIKNTKSGNWALPPVELLHSDQEEPTTGDINASANIIKRTLSNFGIDVEMGEVSVGPTVTRYTLRPAVGVKLSRITALNPDLSLALAAHPIRIEAPIPGKSLVGIEIPNKKVAIIGLRNMFEHDDYKKSKYFLPLAMGRDVSGVPVFAGLEKMPHLLIAGATGSGKSVSINTVLLSMLYRYSPDVLKFILIDPKRVELTLYNGIPHLITPVITDNKKVIGVLRWAVSEMDRRFDILSKASSRDVFSYNAKMTAQKEDIMPFMVIVIDELADLMATYGRDIEAAIVRLAQMSRAVGIHLIVSTQRPSVEVITGLIKANITSRVAFQVASQVDSRTILDMSGAEKLLGNGDMLYLAGDTGKPRRLQGAFVSEKEVKDVVKFIKMQAENMEVPAEGELGFNFENSAGGQGSGIGGDDNAEDDLYSEAKEVVVLAGKASASLLQRRLRVGYARAARLLDILEDKGIIGPGDGAKPREVYVSKPSEEVSPESVSLEATGVVADTIEAEKEEEI
ncbi:MAG: translocase FtsK protein [Candidatus Yanofskybacteria bacterium GW2011_GWC2_41_9]|uniref:Translocase FtsK protein n=1 Tax=Candidatus Yanofskybacteria bacterium GW2011_GWC2_41_9 TaxID=1619029 RepID=A0A0G1AQE1_9BACT|nr:MAG: translocase FtsK protein [Candidatus Yanofskybacteria bacterium GW2011_GWC2_41_9]